MNNVGIRYQSSSSNSDSYGRGVLGGFGYIVQSSDSDYTFGFLDSSDDIAKSFFEVFECLNGSTKSITINGLTFTRKVLGPAGYKGVVIEITVNEGVIANLTSPAKERMQAVVKVLKGREAGNKELELLCVALSGGEVSANRNRAASLAKLNNFQQALVLLDKFQSGTAKLNPLDLEAFFERVIGGQDPATVATEIVAEKTEKIVVAPAPGQAEKQAFAQVANAQTQKEQLERILVLNGAKLTTDGKDNEESKIKIGDQEYTLKVETKANSHSVLLVSADGKTINLSEVTKAEFLQLQGFGLKIKDNGFLGVLLRGMKLKAAGVEVPEDLVMTLQDAKEYLETIDWYVKSHPGIKETDAAALYAGKDNFMVVLKETSRVTFALLKEKNFKSLYEKLSNPTSGMAMKEFQVLLEQIIKNAELRRALLDYAVKLGIKTMNQQTLDKLLLMLISLADISFLSAKEQLSLYGIKVSLEVFAGELTTDNIVKWTNNETIPAVQRTQAALPVAAAVVTGNPILQEISQLTDPREKMVKFRQFFFEMQKSTDGREEIFRPIKSRGPQNQDLGSHSYDESGSLTLDSRLLQARAKAQIMGGDPAYEKGIKLLQAFSGDITVPAEYRAAAMQWRLFFLTSDLENIRKNSDFSTKYNTYLEKINTALLELDTYVLELEQAEDSTWPANLKTLAQQARVDLVRALVDVYKGTGAPEKGIEQQALTALQKTIKGYLDLIPDSADKLIMPELSEENRMDPNVPHKATAIRTHIEKQMQLHPVLHYAKQHIFSGPQDGSRTGYEYKADDAGKTRYVLASLLRLGTDNSQNADTRMKALGLRMYILYCQLDTAIKNGDESVIRDLVNTIVATFNNVKTVSEQTSLDPELKVQILYQAQVMLGTRLYELAKRVVRTRKSNRDQAIMYSAQAAILAKAVQQMASNVGGIYYVSPDEAKPGNEHATFEIPYQTFKGCLRGTSLARWAKIVGNPDRVRAGGGTKPVSSKGNVVFLKSIFH